MRNQQTKKVNRIFFSGQDEEKRKWLEQMAAEGWLLISETSFIYSFQRISSEKAELQPSYRVALEKDYQGSMPLFLEPKQDWIPLLSDKNLNQNNPTNTLARISKTSKQVNTARIHRALLAALAILIFLSVSFTKIAMISSGDFWSLFTLQFITGILFIGGCFVFGMILLLKSFLKILSPECKSKK